MSTLDITALVAGATAPGDPQRRAWYDLNDTGNADRMCEQFGERLRWVKGIGWLAWTGTHWSAEDGEAIAIRFAQETVASMSAEIGALERDREVNPALADQIGQQIKDLRRFQRDSGNMGRIVAMLRLAQVKQAATLSDFDREKEALNVLNGTLRWTVDDRRRVTIELHPHRASDMISKIAEVEYDPDAHAPLWMQHLDRVMPRDDTADEQNRRQAHFARVMAYTMTGLTDEQMFFVHQGRGGDGKSTSLNTLARLMGNYATTADVQTFVEPRFGRNGSEASPDRARLAGDVRFVSTSEPPRGARLNDNLLKVATGGGQMTARHLHQDIFRYLPRFKLHIEMNAMPAVGDDDGIWRRISVLKWTEQIRSDERDRGLEDKLFAERSGVLNWLLNGLEDYYARGLAAPPEVEEATSAYRAENDDVGEWLRERCDRDASAVELATALFHDYCAWCAECGYEARSQKTFGTQLQQRDVVATARTPGKGTSRRKGVRLRPTGVFARSHAAHANEDVE